MADMLAPPPFAAAILSGAHGRVVLDSPGPGPLFWPSILGVDRILVAVSGSEARAAMLCGMGLGGGMTGTMAAMQGGASAAVGIDVARVLAAAVVGDPGRNPKGGLLLDAVALEKVAVEYKRPAAIPAWLDVRASATKAPDGTVSCRSALWDPKREKELVVVTTGWISREASAGDSPVAAEVANGAEKELPAALQALVDAHGDAGNIAITDRAFLEFFEAGRPVVISHLGPPDDPRTHALPPSFSRSQFIWVSRKEGRLYSLCFSVSWPKGLESWYEVPRKGEELLSAGGSVHPAIPFTIVDLALTGLSFSFSKKVTATSTLSVSTTPEGRRFLGGWTRTTGKVIHATEKRVRITGEVADEAGRLLMTADGEFAAIGPLSML